MGEGRKIRLVPLVPLWEKGLGDEGNYLGVSSLLLPNSFLVSPRCPDLAGARFSFSARIIAAVGAGAGQKLVLDG